MQSKWRSKKASWGESAVGIALAGILALLEPLVGIPILIFVFLVGCYLIWSAYRDDKKATFQQKSVAVDDSIKHIPDVLHKMDDMLWKYVQKSPINISGNDKLEQDIADILKFNRENVKKIMLVMRNGEQSEKSIAMDDMEEQINKSIRPEYFKALISISGLLDHYGLGLKVVKNTAEYQALGKELDVLKRQSGVLVNEAVANYLLSATGYYSMLLILQNGRLPDDFLDILPPKVKGVMPNISEMYKLHIDQQLAMVTSAVSKELQISK